MADSLPIVPAPNSDVEVYSSAPSSGSGANAANNRIDSETILYGQVHDTYGSYGAYLVSVPNKHSSLPCINFADVARGLFGSVSVQPLPIGVTVAIYVPHDSKCGYILGTCTPIDDNQSATPSFLIAPEGGVNVISKKEAFAPEDWNLAGTLPRAAAGVPKDFLPGDAGSYGDMGLFVGILRAMALFRASDLAKIEAFTIDDLLRVTGHNLELRSSVGEVNDSSIFGRIDREELSSINQHESLGMGEGEEIGKEQATTLRNDPENIAYAEVTEDATGKWRHVRRLGHAANIEQSWVTRPPADPTMLNDKAKDLKQAGMYHSMITRLGAFALRSLGGGGVFKTNQIAVPIKLRDPLDPGADQAVEAEPVADFDLTGGAAGPMGAGCKVSDFLAYQFSKVAMARFLELNKNFFVPEEADCSTPHKTIKPPGKGEFFREFPDMVDLGSDIEGVQNEPGTEPRKAAPGEAHITTLPDGSVSIQDIWGSSIQMRGGRVIITASNGIELHSGGSIVSLAGNDIIQRARNSIDLSSTEQQVRIQGDRGVFIHSESAGIQISSAPTSPLKKLDATGEKYFVPGIVFKSGTTVEVVAERFNAHLDSQFYVGPNGGQRPSIYTELRSFENQLEANSLFAVKSGGGTFWAQNGSIYGSQDVRVDGGVQCKEGIRSDGVITTKDRIYAEGQIFTRGSVIWGGSGVKADPLRLPPPIDPLNSIETQSIKDAFLPKKWTDLQYPLLQKELKSIKFTYRSEDEYGTGKGKWFEAQWQRDLAADLVPWEEKSIEETYPYPGKKHFTGANSFYTYEPANLTKDGKPVKRSAMKASGGKLTGQAMSSYPIQDR